jgi:hypothetical protein
MCLKTIIFYFDMATPEKAFETNIAKNCREIINPFFLYLFNLYKYGKNISAIPTFFPCSHAVVV